jgi:hypothetical protein
MSSNSTKNFSKLSQGISGGLVPAYATLAAQLFALDALFRFLKDAADFRVLKEGQMAFAQATGTAYKSLARDIQTATDAQITYADASQAAAIGMASGLNPEQLKQLSAAARTVSIALGRDTTDSFNRLVRGVTKAEPELLDELGIILRLEEASTRYAAALGLNKNSLTTFQKSQAVTNEVLRQTEEKFGAMNDISDTTVNQIAKMSIAFDEVMNAVKGGIAPIAEFFGKFLADNIQAAALAVGVFASSMLKKLLPPLAQVDVASRRAFLQSRFTGAGGVLKEGKEGSAQQERNLRFASGKETKDDLARMDRALGAKKSKLLNYENFRRGEAKKTQFQLRALSAQHVVDESTGFKKIGAQWRVHLNQMKADYGAFIGTIRAGARAIGTAFNTMLGVIGWLAMGWMAITMAMDYFKSNDPKDLHAEAFKKKVDKVTGSLSTLNEELRGIADITEKGIITDLNKQMIRMGNALNSASLGTLFDNVTVFSQMKHIDTTAYTKFLVEYTATIESLARIAPEVFGKYNETLRTTADLQVAELPMLRKKAMAMIEVGNATRALEQNTSQLVIEQNKLTQALGKIKYQSMMEVMWERERLLELTLEHLEKETLAYRQNSIMLTEVTAKLQFMLEVQKQHIRLQRLNIAVQELNLTKGFFQTKDAKDALVFQTQRLKIAKEMQKISDAEASIKLFATEGDTKKVIQTKRVLELAEATLQLEQKRLVLLKLQNDNVFKAYNKLFDGFQKDLGSAIGGALRGEEGAFKKIGENMLKTLTDAIGNSLSEMMMEAMIPDAWKPKNMADKVLESHEEGAAKIKESLVEGTKDFASDFLTAFNEGGTVKLAFDGFITGLGDTMDGAITSLKHAQADLLGLEIEQRNKDLSDKQTQMEKKGPLKYDDKGNPIGIHGMTTGIDNKASPEWMKWLKEQLVPKENEITGLTPNQYEVDRGAIIGGSSSAAQASFIDRENQAKSSVAEYNVLGQHLETMRAEGAYGTDIYMKELIEKAGGVQALIDELVTAGVVMDTAKIDRYKEIDDKMMGHSANKFQVDVGKAGGLGKDWTDRRDGSLSDAKIEDWFYGNQKRGAREGKGLSGEGVTQEVLESMIVQMYINKGGDPGRLAAFNDMYGDKGVGGAETTVGVNATLNKEAELQRQELMKTNTKVLENVEIALIKNTDAVEENTTDKKTETLKDDKKTGSQMNPALADFEKGDIANSDFVSGTQQLLGGTAMLLGAAGRQEEAAKLFKIAGMIMMTVAIMERAALAAQGAKDFGGFIMNLITGKGGTRYGGIQNSPGYVSFSGGGIAAGPNSGYGAVLHGTEAVVPLGNDRSIPVEMKGGGAVNNTSVTVNMAEGSTTTTSDAQQGKAFAQAIQASILETIAREQRSGGLLETSGGG